VLNEKVAVNYPEQLKSTDRSGGKPTLKDHIAIDRTSQLEKRQPRPSLVVALERVLLVYAVCCDVGTLLRQQ
jgi:hypothetical protein